MADARLRRLERLSGAGDPAAGARLLLERVRQGELALVRVRLAAALGDPAARAALSEPPLPPAERDDLRQPPDEADAFGASDDEDWLDRLATFGKEPLVRAAVHAARPLLDWFEQEAFPGERRARAALEAAEAWLAQPEEAWRVRARLAGEAASEAENDVLDGALDDAAVFAVTAFALTALAAGALQPERALACVRRAIMEADTVALERGGGLGAAGREARAALIAWALRDGSDRRAAR